MIPYDADSRPPHRLRMLCLAALLLALGCGPHRNAPVNVQEAQQTLKATLEKWKQGSQPADLQAASPQIVVQDMDWSAGAKLLDFELLGAGEPVDANLIAQVKLKLLSPEGKAAEKTVTYVVGTSPVLTVFRDMMR